MIRKSDFKKIEIETENAVRYAFEKAKENQKNINDYILFLCNAHFIEEYNSEGMNPYVIDYRMDGHYDIDRLKFMMEYLNHNYSFYAENTADSKTSMSIEMMIYTHMWESKPYLKLLKKLADLCAGQDYNWNVEIPDYTKHDFIRTEIRGVFKNHNLKIHEIITEGYHSSLRNAFAHSEYVFELNQPEIYLTNYKGKNWEIKKISFDEWTIRFCNTFLLSYKFQEKIASERKNLIDGEPGYEVFLKDSNGNDTNGKILYNSEFDSFNGKIIR